MHAIQHAGLSYLYCLLSSGPTGYLSNCRASPALAWYQISDVHDRGIRANNLPRVVAYW